MPGALLLAVPVLLGAACAVIQRDTERMLVAAGFHMRPEDSTELQEDLRSIPPHRLVSRTKDGNVVYSGQIPTVVTVSMSAATKSIPSTSVAAWRASANRRQGPREGRREHRAMLMASRIGHLVIARLPVVALGSVDEALGSCPRFSCSARASRLEAQERKHGFVPGPFRAAGV